MCSKRQVPQAYASFDAKDFEQRRLRLEQLLDNEIQRRGLSLPEPPAEPLALPMPSRFRDSESTPMILDAEFQETSALKSHLKALRALLVSITIAGSLISYVILASQS